MEDSFLADLKKDGIFSQILKRLGILDKFSRDHSSVDHAKNWELINETLLAADAANIDITGIPQTYKALKIILNARTTEVTTWNYVRIRFNNDSGANYNSQQTFSSAASITSAEELAQTSGNMGMCTAANATDALFSGVCELTIPDYAGTNFYKICTKISSMWFKLTTGGLQVLNGGVAWHSTAPINRITTFPTSNNFKAGTRQEIWGLK